MDFVENILSVLAFTQIVRKVAAIYGYRQCTMHFASVVGTREGLLLKGKKGMGGAVKDRERERIWRDLAHPKINYQ